MNLTEVKRAWRGFEPPAFRVSRALMSPGAGSGLSERACDFPSECGGRSGEGEEEVKEGLQPQAQISRWEMAQQVEWELPEACVLVFPSVRSGA